MGGEDGGRRFHWRFPFFFIGMVQFKDYFLGKTTPPYPAAVTVQNCMRAGGQCFFCCFVFLDLSFFVNKALCLQNHREAQRPGQCRVHPEAPHLLRNAGQLFIRQLLQGGRHHARLGLPHKRAQHRPHSPASHVSPLPLSFSLTLLLSSLRHTTSTTQT